MTQTGPDKHITIELFPAKNGDSILVSNGDFYLLIDTGYPETFNDYLLDRLNKLNAQGKKLLRVIITHIDQDHIAGAIPFFETNGLDQKKSVIEIEQVWHNSYRHLHLQEEAVAISTDGELQIQRLAKSVQKNIEGKVSAKQGSSLASLLLKGGYSWNTDYSGSAILARANWVTLADSVEVQVLSPTVDKLEKLEKYWKRELGKLGFHEKLGQNELFDDAFEFLLLREKERNEVKPEKPMSASTNLNFDKLYHSTFKEDNSATNGSSIAFILKMSGKKLLFLGDAHPSVIQQSLESFYSIKDQPIHFDFIKIAHHGSYFNSTLNLFNIIDAPKFAISTNGEHHHPNLEVLAWIIGRPTKDLRELFFNYEHPIAVLLASAEDWKTKYKYTVSYPALQQSQIIHIK